MKRTRLKLAVRTVALCAMGALILECSGDDSNNGTGTGGAGGSGGADSGTGTGGREGGTGGAGGTDASTGSGGMGTGGTPDASVDGAGGGGTGGGGTDGAAGSDAPAEGGIDAGSVTPVVQVLLDGATIPKYVEPLPTMSGHRVTGAAVAVDMVEFQQQILPASVYAALSAPYTAGTTLWGYKMNNGTASWPASTIEAQQGTETVVTYTNSLQAANGGPPVLARYLTTDLTLHWADPLGQTNANHCMDEPPIAEACLNAYAGPVPAVVHLHGAEVLSDFDGQPDTWFTPGLALKGPAYVSNQYHYPNRQEATTLWFHDHALGRTRINVYSGLAGFYLLRDARDTGLTGNAPGLPAGDFEQELMISDRQFDRNGQLFFPNGLPRNPIGINGPPPNPDHHPYWNPEFFGDVVTVNGKSWPYMNVEPRAYRFRVLDASNARFYRMHFEDTTPSDGGPPDAASATTPAIFQIGSDGGFFNTPQQLNNPYDPAGDNILFLAPAERADVIIDFSGHAGHTFTLMNDANAPFPSGDPPDPGTAGQIMQFRVGNTLADGGTAAAFNPNSVMLRAPAAQIVNIKPGGGGITPNKTRQLVLVEVEGLGGPLEVLLNNSHWDGTREGVTPVTPIPGSTANKAVYSTELPQVGSTEEWEIANLTEDAHPIHIHLIQFQVINRQNLTVDMTNDDQPALYRATYDAAFPGGMFIPGYGPPLPYTPAADAGANAILGGNPPFGPFDGAVIPPDGTESGWKDTIKMLPKTVTRIAIRWAPTATPRNGAGAAAPGMNLYPFNPSLPGPGYAWHCHILDHEDNEMMRPYLVAP